MIWVCYQFTIFGCESIVNLEARAFSMEKESDEFGRKKGGSQLSENQLYSLWMNFITAIIGARGPFSRHKADVIPTRLTKLACKICPNGPPYRRRLLG